METSSLLGNPHIGNPHTKINLSCHWIGPIASYCGFGSLQIESVLLQLPQKKIFVSFPPNMSSDQEYQLKLYKHKKFSSTPKMQETIQLKSKELQKLTIEAIFRDTVSKKEITTQKFSFQKPENLESQNYYLKLSSAHSSLNASLEDVNTPQCTTEEGKTLRLIEKAFLPIMNIYLLNFALYLPLNSNITINKDKEKIAAPEALKEVLQESLSDLTKDIQNLREKLGPKSDFTKEILNLCITKISSQSLESIMKKSLEKLITNKESMSLTEQKVIDNISRRFRDKLTENKIS